jgi:hypothetical protein
VPVNLHGSGIPAVTERILILGMRALLFRSFFLLAANRIRGRRDLGEDSK